MSTSNHHPSIDEVFDRLVALNEEADRRLEVMIKKMGITRKDFEAMAVAAKALPKEQAHKLRAELEAQLAPSDGSTERAFRPDAKKLGLSGLRVLRA